MSDCINKELGEKLFAYELGLLSESEIEEIEIHLIDCEYCQAKAAKFLPTSNLIRNNSEFKKTVAEVDFEIIQQEKIDSKGRQKKTIPSRFTRFIPAVAITTVILMFLILKPWDIEIKPDLEAIAAQNKMAIMYFENLTDETDAEKFGEIATNLLITDLSESKYLSVLSNQRLYDVLKLRGMEGTKKITKEIALEIARESEAKWILFGSILQIEPEFIITTQMIDSENGQVKASQRINGTDSDNIFTIIDKLSFEIKSDLALPDEAIEETDPAVADVTTHSPEAYRRYIKGIEASNKFYESEATKYYLEALEFDSNFAMAYYKLAAFHTGPEVREYIQKARDRVDRVSKRERIYIQGRAAYILDSDIKKAIEILEIGTKKYTDDKHMYYLIGIYTYLTREYEKAITNLKKATEIDSQFLPAINYLAYTYQSAQDYDNAVITINKYIELVPDEPNPRDTRGDIYLRAGNFEKAKESYEKAIELKPDFEASIQKLADLKMVLKEFDEAQTLYTTLLNSDIYKYKKAAETGLILINIYKGKLKGSLPILDSLLTAKSKSEQNQYNLEISGLAHLLKSKIFYELNRKQNSLDQFDLFLKNYRTAFPYNQYPMIYVKVQLLCELNQFDRAQDIIDELKKNDTGDASIAFKHLSALGLMEYTKGNLDSASALFKTALDTSFAFYTRYMYGQSQKRLGKLECAINQFSYMDPLNYMNSPTAAIWNIKSYYYLGCLCEESHQYGAAKYYFDSFLGYWEKADIEIPEIQDAISKLKHIDSVLKK